MNTNRDTKILEAILFASGSPVLEDDLKDKIINKKDFKQEMENLKEFYKDRGINLVKTGNKWSFRTAESIKDELTIFKTQNVLIFLQQSFYMRENTQSKTTVHFSLSHLLLYPPKGGYYWFYERSASASSAA